MTNKKLMHMMLLECTVKEVAEDSNLVEKMKKNQTFFSFLQERGKFLLMVGEGGDKEDEKDDVMTQFKILLSDLEGRYKQKEFIQVEEKKSNAMDLKNINDKAMENVYETVLGKLTVGEHGVALNPGMYSKGGEAFPMGGFMPLDHPHKHKKPGPMPGVGAMTNPRKMAKLVEEVELARKNLPKTSTNAIFLRYNPKKMDEMQAIIMGAEGTPYAHGAFLFDIYFPDTYPQGPPKVNLVTTGNGSVRFNPNLYNNGYVCLSLLGTWRGQASENWDEKKSNLLQVLLSIQSIVMNEDILGNEPGYDIQMKTGPGKMENCGY